MILTRSFVHFRLFFDREHTRLPDNKGEKRECLTILEQVGMKEGLLRALATDGEVTYFIHNLESSNILLILIVMLSDWYHRRHQRHLTQIEIVFKIISIQVNTTVNTFFLTTALV